MTLDKLSIIWSSRVNWEREKDDFYPTPPHAVYPLIQMEEFEWSILEPACGEWDISECFINKWYEVISTDLVSRWYWVWDIDFLLYNWEMVDNIVTNPPFRLAKDFIRVSKKYAKKRIAMLLKTTFLEWVWRYEMFQDKDFPLKTVYQFCRRVTFSKRWEWVKSGWLIAYAWFVRDKDHIWPPNIKWIK